MLQKYQGLLFQSLYNLCITLFFMTCSIIWLVLLFSSYFSTISLIRHLTLLIALIGIVLVGLFIFCQWKLWKESQLSSSEKAIGIFFTSVGIILIYFLVPPLKYLSVFLIYGMAFFLIHWIVVLMKRHQNFSGKKVVQQVTKSCSLAVLCLLFFIGSCLAISKYFSQFDPEVWAQKPENRMNMVEDLTTDYQLKGMTQAEIIQLLGKPDHVIQRKHHILVYDIGFGPLDLDPSTLDIWLDANGRVIQYQITKG